MLVMLIFRLLVVVILSTCEDSRLPRLSQAVGLLPQGQLRVLLGLEKRVFSTTAFCGAKSFRHVASHVLGV